MKVLLLDKVYVINVLGYIAYNFVIGAYSYWGPKAGYDIYHMSNADLMFGGITIVCGIFGTLAGGYVLDCMSSTISNAFKGPVNYVCLHCVKPSMRPLSMAMSTVAIHIFGDVPSSPLVGVLQDYVNNWRETSLILTSVLFLAAGIWLLGIFCMINMLNYVDRGAIASNGVNGSLRTCTDSGICTAGSGIQGDFNLNYFEDGLLSSAFMVGLLVASPIFASLSKSHNPFRLIGVGLSVWTVATASCGFSFDFWSIMICRMLVGVGEASFISLAAPFIDDNAPVAQKTAWLSVFYMFIPTGTALGYVYGALVGDNFSWRYAFWGEAILMLPFAVLGFVMKPLQLKGFVPAESKKALTSIETVAPEVEGSAINQKETLQFFLRNKLNRISITENHAVKKGGQKSMPFLPFASLFSAFETNDWQTGDPQRGRRPEMTASERPVMVEREGWRGTESILEYDVNVSIKAFDVSNQVSRFLKDMKVLLLDKVYVINLLGYIAYNFVIGAYSYWGPKAGYDIYHMSNADLIFGVMTIVCGILGSLAGGYILDCMSATISNAFKGPVNYVCLHCVKPSMRPLSMAMSTVAIHLFGDVPSSPLVGVLQDYVNNWRETCLILTSVLFLAAGIWFAAIFLRVVDRFDEDSEHQVTRVESSNTRPLLEGRRTETPESSAES
ncbi:hypothetical protein HHK36_003187 [Tetracentron sinense]|uniref:Major facilitator superfamily (MFS) profile domain-containing protein n=1 Tax=Tetracentron sinense TaxID=13715 RepID=A0A834ZS26_TETSI|nr:hypothetical protein HHK36_003187 [Tetracentron sinense]